MTTGNEDKAMPGAEGQSSELGRKRGRKKKIAIQIVLFAVVAGLIAVTLIYLRRPRANDSAQLSSNPETFQPDRNYAQSGDLPLLTSAIMAGTEQFWTREFDKAGKKYRPPTAVLFNGTFSPVCGYTKEVSGSFYCPKEERIYVDLSVTRELFNRGGMDGNFAQAYILTHLVGHHIQKLLSTTETSPVDDGQLKDSDSGLELQAELCSGIMFAHYQKLKGQFEEKEIEKWLTTASDIAGNLCKQTQNCLAPHPFTHANLQQRYERFGLGLKMSDSERTDFLKGKPGF